MLLVICELIYKLCTIIIMHSLFIGRGSAYKKLRVVSGNVLQVSLPACLPARPLARLISFLLRAEEKVSIGNRTVFLFTLVI